MTLGINMLPASYNRLFYYMREFPLRNYINGKYKDLALIYHSLRSYVDTVGSFRE